MAEKETNNDMGKMENVADDVLDLIKAGFAIVGFYAIGTILVKVMTYIDTKI